MKHLGLLSLSTMNNWLTRLFGKSEEMQEEVAVSAQEAVVEEEIDPQLALNLMHSSDVNNLFYRWLIGQSEQSARPPVPEILGQKILQALEMTIKSEGGGGNLVPRVPAVIPQLLRSLRDENMSAGALSRQIAHDVVLVAEVIHEANSPFYRPAKPIHSLENAVLLLGQNGLRLLIARVAFRPIINLQVGHFTKQVAPHIWMQAELCADACNFLGPEMQADPFESFLSGLMQNVGTIVAFRMIDRGYTGKYLPDSDVYCFAFNQAVRHLSASIARAWDFPHNVVEAIEHLGELEHPVSQSALGRVLQMSDQISKLRILVDHGLLEEDEYFAKLGLNKQALRCLDVLKRRERNAA